MEASTGAPDANRIKGKFIPDYPIEDLKIHPRNPRIGDVGKIAESLRKHGQARPIVVDKDGVILAGNHTFKAAKEVGWQHIDVYSMPYDYDTSLSFLVADNRLSDLGTYNDEELLGILTELMEADNLAGTGFTGEDVDDILAGAGEVADAPVGTGEQQFSPEATAEHWNRPEEGGAPAEALKDVTLNYPEGEFAQFEKAVKKLQKEWGVASVRGAVLEAVLRQAGMKEAPKVPDFDEMIPPAKDAPEDAPAADEAPVPPEQQAAPEAATEPGATTEAEAPGTEDEPQGTFNPLTGKVE